MDYRPNPWPVALQIRPWFRTFPLTVDREAFTEYLHFLQDSLFNRRVAFAPLRRKRFYDLKDEFADFLELSDLEAAGRPG